jgi:uncharacterized protein YjbI with pentapeptide repeats
MLTTALAVAAVVLGLLWLLLGMPSTTTTAPLGTSEIFDGLKIALTVVAGVGGVVALVVAYRRQQLGELAESREQVSMLTERFGAAAAQLGAADSTVRMAGAYAMARLADDWAQHRQTCIDVLCSYLRMPHAPEPPEAEPEALAWRRERTVRLTVLQLIAAHLRDTSPQSWSGYNLDFTGAVLDEADFRGARFTGGDVVFINTLFVGHGYDQVVFDDAEFAAGSSVYFRLAEFHSGHVRFNRTIFSGGWVSFDSARFTGAEVTFREARFAAGEVRFEDAEFAAGTLDFAGAVFTGADVNFGEHHAPTVYTTVPSARFTGGTVDLSSVASFTHPPRFDASPAISGLLLPTETQTTAYIG